MFYTRSREHKAGYYVHASLFLFTTVPPYAQRNKQNLYLKEHLESLCFDLKERVLFVLGNLVSLALLHLLVLNFVFSSTLGLGKELLSLKSRNTSGACVDC